MNFSTEKDFSWMDQWNLAEAPDRRVRRCGLSYPNVVVNSSYFLRLMERDNKKAREDARREYNETVRVRKQNI